MKHLISFVLALLAVCLPATAQLRFTKVVTNILDLRALDTRDIHKSVYVRGFTTSGDGGEGIFVADEAAIEPHFPGMVETNIGPGRFVRSFDRPEFPATWFGTPVDNSVLNSAISWASSNGFGYVIMPLGDTAVDPITNAVTLKNNVSLIWPPGANWVVDHVPSTNWTLLSVVGVTNFALYSPSLVGVTNIPGDILNFGRLITILSSTNGFILDPKLEAEYSDAIYWGDDLSTNANQNITVSGANQTVMDANPGTRLAADLNYRRVTNLVELSLADVSKQNLLVEVYSQSDTNITGFWQYDPDNSDSTNATDTVALINFSGRFKKIASFGTDGGGGGGITINPTDNYVPYRIDGSTFGDSPWYRISDLEVGFNITNRFIYSIQKDLVIGHAAPLVDATNDWLTVVGNNTLPIYYPNGFSGSVVVGGDIGLQMTNGFRNTLIGHRVFTSGFINGNANTMVGYGAGALASSFNNGTAFGDSALGNATVSGDAFGVSTLILNQGGGNAAFGSAALSQNTTGSDNTAVGYFAGSSNSVGRSSVFVGNGAGQSMQGSFNTIVGASAASNGANPLFAATATNSIAIGFNVHPLSSNAAQIGTNGISVLWLNGTVGWFRGTGAPGFAAPIGSYYSREDGGAGTSFYVNEDGTGGGWAAK